VLELTRFEVVFAPVNRFPAVDPQTRNLIIQVEVDAARPDDITGTVAINLAPGDGDDADSMKRLAGLALHSVSHILLGGTVMGSTTIRVGDTS